MSLFYTYLHCKPDGTPFYVGKGKGKRCFRINREHNPHHQHIVKKYGKENIKVYVFECDSEEQAFADEVQQIAMLRLEGYQLTNLTDGGEGVSGHKHSEQTKVKLSISSRGRKMPPCSESRKAKISLANKGNKNCLGKQNMLGKSHSTEAKERISASLLGNKRAAGSTGHIGMKRSNETKERISFNSSHRSAETLAKISYAASHPTDETRRRISASAKAAWAKRKAQQ